eukprot:CAMPEP_0194226206 /NCGR_PEP_ID=MMETSP0156-20130528/41386_1 /TAXON_ID=33649 /ORGANISM="Thalassionema nitzschioides, Strain L26-B" /LENGTH=367 /DNA_ID=CAMNT_0038958491 /DNA_START=164 /DNA_END=1270 /DNA_ORIENTATION=+
MALCLSLTAGGDNLLPGWKRACVDYSAANEYISVHYGMDNYFAGAQQTTTEVDVRNARNGVYNFDQQGYVQPKLSDCGFQLISTSPKNHDDSNKDYDASQLIRTIDWNNPNDVTKHYISSYLRNEVIPSCFDQDEILCFAFWNPTVRGEDLPMSSDRSANVTKTAPVAATVHIDTDINACANSSELVHLLLSDKNRVHEDDADFDENQFIRLIEQGHRFVLLNFWQTILPEPVQRAPLGILSVKYQKSKNIAAAAFPDAYPDLEKSLWYCFPDMIPQECLVFKQYDRDASYASDIWHCGLSSIQTSITGPAKKRKNFDVRAFVILKEQVSRTTNRFVPTRRKSELTLDESKCFCSEQAQRRREDDQK